MSNVPYHAWTHRPKAQGGTDPIQVPSASYARASRIWPADDALELTTPGTLTPIPFTQMWTNNTAVFGKDDGTFLLDDSGIRPKVAGLYKAECKVEFIHDGNAYFQCLLSATDLDTTDERFLLGGGQHGANVGVLTGEGGTFESTVWGYDTQNVVWLGEPGGSAEFHISVNIFEGDGGVGDPVYVNQARLSVIHWPLASLVEADIF